MEAPDYPKVYLYRRIVQAKVFMDENYFEKIDLRNIADEATFSKFHFIRLFKKAYGKTPHQYLTFVRLENAKRLLQKEGAVADVCYGVGFESISSFTGLFKRAAGLTPAAYQQVQIQKSAQMERSPLQFVPHCFAEKKGWIKKSNFEEGME